MAKRPTRLRFTEDDLADSHVKKAADRADKAVDRAEKAADNGWSVGRLTANGLMGVCDIIPKSSAKPGDLIFFQGTYDTSGASVSYTHLDVYKRQTSSRQP